MQPVAIGTAQTQRDSQKCLMTNTQSKHHRTKTPHYIDRDRIEIFQHGNVWENARIASDSSPKSKQSVSQRS